jgi:TRAP-type C4-dicarboxylate transport system permease small subunit
VIRTLHRVEDGVIAALGLLLVLLAGAQILMRLILAQGLEFAEPLMRTLVLWLAMGGAMVAARESRHIAIDALAHHLPETARRVSRCLLFVGAGLVCGYIAWHATGVAAAESFAFSGLAVPAGLKLAAIPLGFGVMALRFVGAGVRALGGDTGGHP